MDNLKQVPFAEHKSMPVFIEYYQIKLFEEYPQRYPKYSKRVEV